MADRQPARDPSIGSSTTETDDVDVNEKNGGSFDSLTRAKEVEAGDDVEMAELLPGDAEKPAPVKKDNSTRTAVIWMVVNTLATIGIVSGRRIPFIKSASQAGTYANVLYSRSSRTKPSSQTLP